MNLFFDTETTGFHKSWLPVDDEQQPHIVQLAAQLCDDAGKAVTGFSFIIDNGVAIPKEASAVHGITTQIASDIGVSLDLALDAFKHLYSCADQVVAHHIEFDKAIMETAITRRYERYMPLRKPLFCTMEAAAPIVNLPPTAKMIAAGYNRPKSPKLEEAYFHFFGEKLEGAHNAMTDVLGCARVFYHLKSIGAA